MTPKPISILDLLLLCLVSSLAGCETREEIGQLTAREIRTQGPGSTLLTGSTVTVTDAEGHKAVLTPTSLRFYSAEGRVVAEFSATSR